MRPSLSVHSRVMRVETLIALGRARRRAAKREERITRIDRAGKHRRIRARGSRSTNGTCLIRNRERERKRRKSRARASRGTAVRGIDRPPAEYHFFRSRKFFTFSSFDRRRSFARERTRGREKGRKGGPSSSSFPFLRVDCLPSRNPDAPLLVLSFVKLDERSRLGTPFALFLFFPLALPALSTAESSPIERLTR